MAISDHVTRVAKMRARIVTVDPSQRLIEAVTPDGAIRQLATFDVPIGFRWPIENEEWSIYEENGYWRLGNRFLTSDESAAFQEFDPGTSIAQDRAQTLDGGTALNVYSNPNIGDLTQYDGEHAKWASLSTIISAAQEGWHLVGAVGEPSFGVGWSNYAIGNPEASFRKDLLGVVRLRGMLKRVSGSQPTMFILPSGYRPSVTYRQVVPQHDGTSESTLRVTVDPAGVLQLTGPLTANSATTWIFIDGVTFTID